MPSKDLARVARRIGALAADPRPAGCEKLTGEEKYRVRQGDDRILYQVNDDSGRIDVVKIGHRREVYRG